VRTLTPMGMRALAYVSEYRTDVLTTRDFPDDLLHRTTVSSGRRVRSHGAAVALA